jgi:hypothetical protein
MQSSITRNTLIVQLCGVCHGNGQDSDLNGRDITCIVCGGFGRTLIPIHELDQQDKDQLSLVAAAESDPRPTPIDYVTIITDGAVDVDTAQP